VCGERERWETARGDAWLRELLTDSSEGEPEDGYMRVEESSKWIAKMTGGAAEASPVGPRDANSEDFVRRADCPARGSGAETEDIACLTQGKSTKV
jgi:hypothetical protein